ncbi:hypothetical protein F5X99DRAFT_398859 [Biscogniauxia marginata]|nr:hypothetical protein F5X99DRAFT_398859 [Biscogniauxia marginata]
MIVIPQEIFDTIVSYVDYETRRSVLTVSRRFQLAIERLTWRDIHVNGDDIESFQKLCTSHRTEALRELTFEVKFPNLRPKDEESLVSCRPTIEEIRADNELFTSQSCGLFRALKIVEEQVMTSSGNLPRIGRSWRLCLLRPHDLPELSWIKKLSFGENGRCYYGGSNGAYEFPLDLRMLIDLSTKLPGLENLSCPYLPERFPYYYEAAVIRHFTHPWEGPWRDSRHNFCAAVKSQLANLPVGLRLVTIRFGEASGWFGGSMDQSRALPNLVAPSSYDPLSSSIRLLSQNLTHLDLQICADSTLFWPSLDEGVGNAPSWPHLKRLIVRFHNASPSGIWYFQGPRGEGRDVTNFEVTEAHYPPLEDNETDAYWDDVWDTEGGREEMIAPDEFRIVPNDEVLEPFLEAFAKALGNMRAIEEAELSTLLVWKPSEERQTQDYPDWPPGDLFKKTRWGIKYNVQSGSRCLEWQVGGWRPNYKLHQLFRVACGDSSGAGLEERWT